MSNLFQKSRTNHPSLLHDNFGGESKNFGSIKDHIDSNIHLEISEQNSSPNQTEQSNSQSKFDPNPVEYLEIKSQADIVSSSVVLSKQILSDITDLKYFCNGDWKKISSKICKTYSLDINKISLKKAYFAAVARKKPKSNFTQQDNELLIALVKNEGMKWRLFSELYFDGICPLVLKNRYYRLTQKERSYKRSVRARMENKLRGKKLEEDLFPYNMKTLVGDIWFEEKPEWLSAFEKIMFEIIV